MSVSFDALAGGVLIGLASVLLMAGNGRIAGVSGIVAGTVDRDRRRRGDDIAFVAGLLAGVPLLAALGSAPTLTMAASAPNLAAAGLLVGFGARLGSGCTSGHGVCGLARLSPRSAAAVGMFMASALATVFVMGRMR